MTQEEAKQIIEAHKILQGAQKKKSSSLVANILGFCIPFALIACEAATVPSDEQCVSQVSQQYLGHSDLAETFAGTLGSQIYQVNNFFLWKTVTNRLTGKKVAVAVFFMVLQ